MTAFWRNLALPVSGPVLLFIVCSAPILWLIAHGGMMALPLALVFLAAFSGYAIALVDCLAHGREVPVLSIETLNPTHDARPLLAGILMGVALAVCFAAGHFLPAPAALLATGLVLLTLPAALALLCVHEHRLAAFSPWHVGRLAVRLGKSYGVYALLVGVYAVLLAAASSELSGVPLAMLVETALLSLAAGLGGLLYDQRAEIGLEVQRSPELDQARADRQDDLERERVLHEAYGMTRAKRVEEAWEALSVWTRGRGNRIDDLEWLQSRTALWADQRISARLVREVVSGHLRLGESPAALDAVERWLAGGGSYRSATARDLGRLVGLARLSGRAKLGEMLLDACGSEYAGDPEIAGLLAHRVAPDDAARR